MVCHQGGLLLGWSVIRVVCHQVVCHQGGLSSGWSVIRVVCHQSGLLLGWSVIRVVCHQGGLSSGRFVIRVDFRQRFHCILRGFQFFSCSLMELLFFREQTFLVNQKRKAKQALRDESAQKLAEELKKPASTGNRMVAAGRSSRWTQQPIVHELSLVLTEKGLI